MTQYKILVVDDNADIRELLEILLTSEGYAVTLASSGEQALQLLSPELDLVILDIMMPGISGIRVCEAIRKQSNVPVLFLTAKGQDEDISLGLRVGADDYLPKPFSHAQLTARVKSLLRRYRVYQGKSEPEEDEWLVRGPLRINRTYNEVERTASPSTCRSWNTRCCCSWPPTRGASSRPRTCTRACGTSRISTPPTAR